MENVFQRVLRVFSMCASLSVAAAAPAPTPVPVTAAPAAAPVPLGGKVAASPLARRLAAEKGIDLQVRSRFGSGGGLELLPLVPPLASCRILPMKKDTAVDFDLIELQFRLQSIFSAIHSTQSFSNVQNW